MPGSGPPMLSWVLIPGRAKRAASTMVSPQSKRVMRRGIAETVKILKVPVDPATDDVEVLCVIVEFVKGAHCYGRPRD